SCHDDGCMPPAPSSSLTASFRGKVSGIDLWVVDLDGRDPGAELALPIEDRSDSERLVHPIDRHRFLAGRAAARTVVASYLGVVPRSIQLARQRDGKPSFMGAPPFSFSRSGGIGLLAVGYDREIGVDVERLREIPEASDLAARHLSSVERARWLAEGAGAEAFLRAWTRLEASLKALGFGLTIAEGARASLDDVEVLNLDLLPGHAVALARAFPR
ncbi:MAG: 4'-phosphopantetheinyl transferase superfamily protein, partial [Deltaproteobacteria bacterium]